MACRAWRLRPIIVVMARYRLRLYHLIRPDSTLRKGRGSYEFDAADDLAAIRAATSTYAEAIGASDYVLLEDAGHRLVWEQGSPMEPGPDAQERPSDPNQLARQIAVIATGDD
jgi:hypothetical protein